MPGKEAANLTTSDVIKWREVIQNLRQSSVLLTFLYAKYVNIVYLNM